MIKVDAAILHGKPPRERYEDPTSPKPHEANWLPWLASELGKRGLRTAIPAFPEPYAPNFDAWAGEFEQYDVEQARVIAHSAGAEFILRWLSENPDVSLRQLLLIAPWADNMHKYADFSNYTLDTSLTARVGKVTLINSLDDSPAIQANVTWLRTLIKPLRYVEYKNHGHFMLGDNMTDLTFPDLLSEIK